MSCYFRRYDKDSGKFVSKRILNRDMHFTLLANKKHLEDVRLVREAASEEAARKAKNPTQHQYLFDYNVLPNEDCTVAGTTRVSNTVFVDYDEAELKAAGVTAEQVLDRIVELKEETRLVFACYSLRKNVHAVFLRDPNLTQQQNIEAFNAALGIAGLQPDPTCINNLREGTFATTIKDIVYIDDRLYTEEEMPNLEGSSRKPTKSETSEPQEVESIPVEDEQPTPEAQQAWMECEKRAGLQHGQVDVPHHRYANLIAILSKDFPVYVSEESQALACIRTFMPVYWETEEKKCRSIVHTAYHEWDNSFKMSAEAIKVNAKLQQQSTSTDEQPKPAWMQKAPEMPPLEDLPRPLQLFIKPYPKHLWAPLSVAATVMFNAHASHYRAVYNDGRTIAPPDFCWITNESQSGKFWVEDMKDEMFMNTLAADDKIAWSAHTQNRKERARKSDGKPDKCEQPLNICQTVSQTSILELMRYQGDSGALFCFFPEGSLLAKAKGFKDMTEIQQEGWDGSMHTQYYTTDAAVSCQVRVRLGVLATSTPRVVNQYFRASDNAENGVRNRYMILPFAEEEELTFHAPQKQPLTPEEQAERDGYLLKLWKMNKSLGEDIKMLDMTECTATVDAFLDKWKSIYEAGQLTRTEGKMVRRIGQHMMRAAMPYVALFGGETDEVLNYINWLGDYVYYYQLQLFAEDQARIDAENQRLLGRQYDNRTTETGGVIYSFEIGTEFTWHEFREKYINAGGTENSAKQQLKRLCDKQNPPVISLGKGTGRYRRIA